ncbi:RagB/SusD family nutrient uptake outer membrane protein [Flavobacteriaceae bacterium TP-CH-4]|uniref:RagB/SusD family nutrient uptake outer membrane protein n=1 Tax=Pelagihabitans pacificus TaxID=2696054 RepID=A0A967E4P5_9FLAO|nr:RagB/SusD family nutrient uptake outer membrane protein [Pelagihabitans pacificus]NHF58607.1 RagB/SusD family nutrient uptake outer membrane protein [Pelagihabitans pacificus]
MKTQNYIILSIAFILLWSCDDFLDQSPETFQTPTNFFKTEAQIDEAVAAIYNTNRALNNDEHWRFGENRSDNTSFQYNVNDRGGELNDEPVDLFLMLTANDNLSGYWNRSYTGISRANFALANIDAVEFSDEDIRDARKGEILFLRSWFYFNLVQLYGDVPLVTSPGTSPEVILTDEFLQRAPAEEVYNFIIEEVGQAIDLLPTQANTATGRASRGAALMLLAKIQMVRQNFQAARAALETLQTMGYSLQENYASVFDPDPANNEGSESIFEIQYDFSLGQGSDFVSRFVPFNSGNDILGENGPANSRAGQNQPTQSLIDLYDPEDVRFQHNIGFYTGTNGVVEPWMSKFNFGFEALGPNTQSVNFPMFRYADALLMLAEVYNEVGGGDPVALVEQVRSRSLADGSLSAAELADLDQTIADERRRELAFENHRYFDLLRRGELVEVMTAHGIDQKAQKSNVPAEAYTNIRTLLGIPLGQVQEFGFTQNEGW